VTASRAAVRAGTRGLAERRPVEVGGNPLELADCAPELFQSWFVLRARLQVVGVWCFESNREPFASLAQLAEIACVLGEEVRGQASVREFEGDRLEVVVGTLTEAEFCQGHGTPQVCRKVIWKAPLNVQSEVCGSTPLAGCVVKFPPESQFASVTAIVGVDTLKLAGTVGVLFAVQPAFGGFQVVDIRQRQHPVACDLPIHVHTSLRLRQDYGRVLKW
jgi:hypothetical protein